jgi:branched-chain amino acid transport system substrate-binding protein
MYWLWVLLVFLVITPAGAADLPTVRVGLVVPMASDVGPVAQGMRRAAGMAVAEWGAKLGQRIELGVEEDAFDPKQAVVSAEKLARTGVWGVVGHFYSSSSIAASPVYHEAGIPQVTPTSTHPRLTAQGFDNVFRVCGRDDQQALVAAEFMVAQLKARRIGAAHDRTEYGRGLVETLRREVLRRISRPVAMDESLAQGNKDFGALAARVKEARLDAIYFGGVFREAAHLIRALRQAGVQAAFVAGDAVLDPEFVTLASEEAAVGTYLTFAPDPRLLDSARPLMREYEARYGSIGPHVLSTYDAIGVLLYAIQTAQPADGSREELRKVARAIRARPYQGALGTLRWDRNGDLTTAPYMVYATKRGGSVQNWFEPLPLPASRRN